MARHKVEICGVNTAKLKVLSHEEMVELFKKMKEGDIFARDDLIQGNLKLVLSILKKFSNCNRIKKPFFQIFLNYVYKCIREGKALPANR